MQTPPSLLKTSVTWRGKKFVVEMNSGATVKELGQELQKLTNIQEDTMRLIVPQISSKTSKLLAPFSTEHGLLSLQEASITEVRSIKMMGVSTNEVEEVLQNAKVNLRIAGFEDEEKRLKQRISYGPHFSLKLPQGPYIFCEFRTLAIPGLELNPPPSEALKRMHMLAADPGIVAVMNKHRWRVGIMTEMAPIGYVGVSPKCLLGFNKNHGEEISLRLRTDDLKGFRKYESIKKTLLHELAHMIYSEHDANFYALDKQLNQEAASLDWTRSASHTLSGARNSEVYEDFIQDSSNIPHKLGSNRTDQLISARESSVAAAYHRMANVSVNNSGGSEVNQEPHLDCSSFNTREEPNGMISASKEIIDIDMPILVEKGLNSEPDPDDHLMNETKHEPDPDDSHHGIAAGYDVCSGITDSRTVFEQKPSGFDVALTLHTQMSNVNLATTYVCKEPDPDDSETLLKCIAPAESYCSPEMSSVDRHILSRMDTHTPDSDDLEAKNNNLKHGNSMLLDSVGSIVSLNVGHQVNESQVYKEPAREESHAEINVMAEPDPDDVVVPTPNLSTMQTDEPDPDDQEFQRINDPVTAVCNRLQKALEMLRGEVSPMQTASVLQTLLKIIRNVIEHPEETKYKRLRKANPLIERNIANNKAALEILFLVGFSEDFMLDNLGMAEAYLVLKRNDPGLLWLAKSTLESCITC